MKLIFSFLILSALAFTEKGCRNKQTKNQATCFKGRLEVKAACMNYTISVVEGKIDPELVEASWTDESTGKQYSNAFQLGSKCDFPKNINQGDEFYFVIDTTTKKDCAVCMLYYPVPEKSLSIRVVNEPCSK